MARPIFCGLVVLALTACRASYPAPTDIPLIGLHVHYVGPVSEMDPGALISFTAYAVDGDRMWEDVTVEAHWGSSDPLILQRVSTTPDRFAAVGTGTAHAIASYKGLSAAVPVVVRAVPRGFPFLEIGRPTPHEPGGWGRLSARLVQSGSSSQVVTPAVVWHSSDPRVAVVDGAEVRAVGIGNVEISADYNGFRDWYAFSVGPRSR